ncbi:MAG: cyclopropane-fatty-acyl-phospholipid synthase family protein [Planctomycetota bacterium]
MIESSPRAHVTARRAAPQHGTEHLPGTEHAQPSRSERAKPSLLERAVRSRLRGLTRGSLTVVAPGGVEVYGTPPLDDLASGDVHATAEVLDARFWSALALRGSVGAGEAYAHGWWTSPEPTDVVRVFVANQDALDSMEKGLARLSVPFLKAYHALRDNTRRGAKRNISAHYDLSNDFFSLFLDPSMTYSSAVYERPDATLEEAQTAKIDRLCERLRLGPDDHLLEIGSGWGAFAARAASAFGCRVTTTTISREQYAHARERIARAGLEDRVDVVLKDYRDLEGTFSKIVSVEMIEAVGARHYESFFSTCQRLLAPGGALAMQAITIHDRHFERARRAVDFIQRHIFPGSCIPSVSALVDAARDASDMRLVQLEDVGAHYVPTLREWRDRLRSRRDEAQALGFDDTFLRLFDFYFSYCEGGFAERHISVAHMVFAREGRGFAPAVAGGLLQEPWA